MPLLWKIEGERKWGKDRGLGIETKIERQTERERERERERETEIQTGIVRDIDTEREGDGFCGGLGSTPRAPKYSFG